MFLRLRDSCPFFPPRLRPLGAQLQPLPTCSGALSGIISHHESLRHRLLRFSSVMGLVFRLIGLPFAVIGGTINIAHEGIGIAVDSVAKKRRQRNALHRPNRQYPSAGQCPNCTKCESAISPKTPSYHPAAPIQSGEYSSDCSAQSQGEDCRVPPSYSSLRSGPRPELPSHEPNLDSAELPPYESSRPELDLYAPASEPSELPSQRYTDAAKPDGSYVIRNLLVRLRCR